MDAQVRQAYEVWKKSAEEYMAEMDNVMNDQPPGGRLISVTASMNFAYQSFNTLYEEHRRNVASAQGGISSIR